MGRGKSGQKNRRGKHTNKGHRHEFQLKESDDQAYAQVQKMLGNCRLIAFCFDGQTRLCHIRGKLNKTEWIRTGDIVLVGLRSYQNNKADVLLKYTPDEVSILKGNGSLPESTAVKNGCDTYDDVDIVFVDSVDNDDVVPEQNRKYDLPNFDDISDEETDEEYDVTE